jgi:hypothetical protein
MKVNNVIIISVLRLSQYRIHPHYHLNKQYIHES